MKNSKLLGFLCLAAVVTTSWGCQTASSQVKSDKSVDVTTQKKSRPIRKITSESYALMDDRSATIDHDIAKRGSKVRGLNDY